MNILKTLKTTIQYTLSCYYYCRETLAPSAIKEGMEIPVIINNFNRLTTLKQLTKALVDRGYTNIYILDNASTYPPFSIL